MRSVLALLGVFLVGCGTPRVPQPASLVVDARRAAALRPAIFAVDAGAPVAAQEARPRLALLTLDPDLGDDPDEPRLAALAARLTALRASGAEAVVALACDHPRSPARARALAAFCNAALPAAGPLSQWPQQRAAAGHPRPFAVRYWCLGDRHTAWPHAQDDPIAALGACAAALRAVDPRARVLAPLPAAARQDALATLRTRRSRTMLDGLALLSVAQDGPVASAEALGERLSWRLGVSPDAATAASFADIERCRELGYPAALCAWRVGQVVAGEGSAVALGLGAAALELRLLRLAPHLLFARRERARDAAGELLADTGPLALFAAHRGEMVLDTDLRHVPAFRPPDVASAAGEAVGFLEAAATRRDDLLFIHVANRSYDRERPLRIDLAGAVPAAGLARRYTWQARSPVGASGAPELDGSAVALGALPWEQWFPPRSFSVLVVPLAGG